MMTEAKSKHDMLPVITSDNSGAWLFDISTLCINATNQYQLVGAWQKAEDAFVAAANVTDGYKKAMHLQKAAECCQKREKNTANSARIQTYLTQACEVFLDDGNFSAAGKIKESIAAIAESENRLIEAMAAYDDASKYHSLNNHGKSSMNTCLLNVANIATRCGEYTKATEIFDNVATNYIGNNLMRFQVKPLWVNACLCRVGSDDLVAIKKAVVKYAELDPEFEDSKEHIFLRELIDAVETKNSITLGAAVNEYELYTRLPKWVHDVIQITKNKLDREV